MKSWVCTTLAALAAASGMMIMAPDANANGRHWHGRARVGVYIGAPVVVSPWWYHPRPYYYAPYPYHPYYYPPVVREEPTTYIERTPDLIPIPQPAPQAQAQPQQQQYWYFCQDTQTYYPHVQSCASPWQRVVPHAQPPR